MQISERPIDGSGDLRVPIPLRIFSLHPRRTGGQTYTGPRNTPYLPHPSVRLVSAREIIRHPSSGIRTIWMESKPQWLKVSPA